MYACYVICEYTQATLHKSAARARALLPGKLQAANVALWVDVRSPRYMAVPVRPSPPLAAASQERPPLWPACL
jgi:hypothetical protein